MQLNASQRQAVEAVHGPCLVLAGAGSGKTRVITAKLISLIRDHGLKPARLCALTFTNKAASEMAARVGAQLGAERAAEVRICTFHALGRYFLSQEHRAAGLGARFSLFDEGDTLKALAWLIRERFPQLLLRQSERGAALQAASQIASLKMQLRSPSEVQPRGSLLQMQYAAYEEYLKVCNAVDFEDLICRPVKLLRGDAGVAARWRERFDYVLVDEYQDTNQSQYAFLGELVKTRRDFTVVGDDDQSIYSWRGADPQNLKLLARDFPELKVIKLEQNYRSTQTILSCANQLITHNEHSFTKQLFTELPEGRPVYVREFANEEEEAAFVCAEIVAAHRREGAGAHWADFAVLYRSNTQSRPFERQLREHQVPVKVSGGTSFFDTQEVRDLMGWCRVLCNPHDDAALLRIINVPRRGLGTESLAVLAREARRLRRSLYAAATDAGVASQLQPRQLEALTGLLSLIAKLRGELLRYRDLAVVKSLLAEIGYARHLRRSGLSEAAQAYKMANVQQLMDWIAAMVSGERGGRPLSFAQAVERLELRDREGRDEESADAVQLATLHAAKGLEYACVYLVGLEEGILPHHKSLGTPEALGEERRLAYVGITRARRQLTLTHCFERGQGEHRSCNRRSRFIAELPHEMLKIFSPRDNELPEDQETPELLARFQEQLQAVANGQAGWQDFKGSL